MNKTSLYDEHVKLGAKMVDFAGWEMPIQYQNLREEVLATRESGGVFDVSHMGEVLITGEEVLEFMDYLLPCKIKTVDNFKAVYTPLLRDNGTIIDDLIIYRLSGNQVFICINASNIEKDVKWIKSKANQFDVEVEDVSSMYSLIALQGPDSYKNLTSIAATKELKDIPYYSIQKFEDHQHTPTLIARTGYTGEDGFEIFGSHLFIQSLWSELMNLGVKPCGLGARDVLRLEVGYPLYGNELTDEVTPLESGLKWTLDLNKEDFIGKNALNESQPKSILIKLILDKGIPRAGYDVYNQNGVKLGQVTSGSMSVMLGKGVAIARVDKDNYNKDDELYIEIRNKKYQATKTTKAFYSGGHK